MNIFNYFLKEGICLDYVMLTLNTFPNYNEKRENFLLYKRSFSLKEITMEFILQEITKISF